MAVVSTVLVGRAWYEWRVGAVLHGVDGVVLLCRVDEAGVCRLLVSAFLFQSRVWQQIGKQSPVNHAGHRP